MSPKRAFRYLILFIIITYGGKLVLGRLVIYYDAYGDAIKEHEIYSKQDERCLNDHKTHHAFGLECKKAEREINRWPFISALGKLGQETHSCIEYPCTEILKSALESWVAIITIAFFICIIMIYLLTVGLTKINNPFILQRVKKRTSSAIGLLETTNTPSYVVNMTALSRRRDNRP
ncbi:hypothetical protein LCGC14_3071600 [marine sediment metagenome]|uniref:Uncharacterized protein n=1 Tax=marine sediment metagenome TaxID=412755 RepID=A0A0F8WGJ6_9ZZZZ